MLQVRVGCRNSLRFLSTQWRKAPPTRIHVRSYSVIQLLNERGLVQDMTSRALDEHLATKNDQDKLVERTIYSGVDPSAESLHVGNLLPLISMLHLVTHGHRGLILVRIKRLTQIGGATGAIGDPSGRSTERSALDTQQLEKNVSSIRSQLFQFFHNAVAYLQRRGRIHAAPAPFSSTRTSNEAEPLFLDSIDLKLINNIDWFRDVSALQFLAEVGRFARVNEMMARER